MSRTLTTAQGYGIAVLVVIGVILLATNLWYVLLGILAICYLWKGKKFNLDAKKKWMFSGIVIVIVLIIGSSISYSARAPTLKILQPENASSVQASTVIVNGVVSPSHSSVSVNGTSVSVATGGNYSASVRLSNATNTITIQAKNADNSTSTSITVFRIYTQEEIAQMQAKAEADKKAQDEAIAKSKAELEAYYITPAGKICKKNPTWSKTECQLVADQKIWIGMNLDMLKAVRGVPDSANPSNYGSGTHWQWCWHDYTPSCFYGADDGIITSYN